ncbi:helix-turn-helix transcriptional regulator [Oenococcus sp. UCMA 17063]|nr:helix-turn-helix transcriptional regulator [Oenococcus sp. UCMA 17063]
MSSIFNLKEIGKNIKTLRLSKKLTQEQLSKEIKVSGKSAINNWEHGSNRPSDFALKNMANYFQVNSIDIIFSNKKQLKDFALRSINYEIEIIQNKIYYHKALNKIESSFWKDLYEFYSLHSLSFIMSIADLEVQEELLNSVRSKTSRTFQALNILENMGEKEYKSDLIKKIKETISIELKNNTSILKRKLIQEITSSDTELIKQNLDQIFWDLKQENFATSNLKIIVPKLLFKNITLYNLDKSDFSDLITPFPQIKILKEILKSIQFSSWDLSSSIGPDDRYKIIIPMLKKEKEFFYSLVRSITPLIQKLAKLGYESHFYDIGEEENIKDTEYMDLYFKKIFNSIDSYNG